MFLAGQEKTRSLLAMPSTEKLKEHSLCEFWSLQHGSRAGGRCVRDVLVQDGAGRGMGAQWPRSRRAAAEGAGSSGEQHGAAHFLTLPEAIRAAGPHLELNRAGEGRAGAFLSAGERRWQDPPTVSYCLGQVVPS